MKIMKSLVLYFNNFLVLKNTTLLIILLIILGIPTIFFTFSVMMFLGFHVYLLGNLNYNNVS